MRSITIKNVTIQFDSDQITDGTDLEQAKKAIELINLELQREPFGLGAQIMSDVNAEDVESEEVTDYDDQYDDSLDDEDQELHEFDDNLGHPN